MPHIKDKKLHVAVLFGGKSSEHEVSLVSAKSVMENLDKEKYEVMPIGVTKAGEWLASSDALEILTSGRKTPEAKNYPRLPADLDVVFPLIHGPYGEDGTVQGFLELTGIPYVGCGVLASAVGMDKITQKRLFQGAGITTPQFIALDRKTYEEQGSETTEQTILQQLGLPCFIKPSNMGSSVGISKVKTADEIKPALENAFQYDNRILIERAVIEPREIEISVLGNNPYEISAPGEIVPSNEFYDYHAKYVSETSRLIIPAALEREQIQQINATAKQIAELLDVAGMARVDFLLSKITSELFVSEVNTIPGFTAISMYPKLWETSGLPFSELLDRLIQLAVERNAMKKNLLTSYQQAL